MNEVDDAPDPVEDGGERRRVHQIAFDDVHVGRPRNAVEAGCVASHAPHRVAGSQELRNQSTADIARSAKDEHDPRVARCVRVERGEAVGWVIWHRSSVPDHVRKQTRCFALPGIGKDGRMTIFESLRNDHETQRTLIGILTSTSGASDGRTEVWDRLKRELVAHAGAEERNFYVPLMERDLTQESARHSVAEHKELDDFIEQLDGYDMSGSQWIQTAKELEERLLHHLDEEEHEIFQVAGKALTDDQKASLAEEYEADMERRRKEA